MLCLPDAHPMLTRCAFDSFKASDVKAFLDKWYRPAAAKIFIVGDFNETKMVALLQKVWGSTASLPMSRSGPPVPHPSMALPISAPTPRGLTAQVAAQNLAQDSPGKSEVSVVEVSNADGVSFSITASDPMGYEPHPFTLRSRRRVVYDHMFRLVYAHMVLERVMRRYPEMGEGLPDITIDSQVSNLYELNARLHEWDLTLSGGFGSPSVCRAGTPPWIIELDSALIELKRLAAHGPHPEAVTMATQAYATSLQSAAANSAWKRSDEVVGDLHDDLDGGFGYRTAEHRLKEEGRGGLLNPAIIDDSLSITSRPRPCSCGSPSSRSPMTVTPSIFRPSTACGLRLA